MNKYAVLKAFFERDDIFAPGGGQTVKTSELKDLGLPAINELAPLAAAEMGVELTSSK